MKWIFPLLSLGRLFESIPFRRRPAAATSCFNNTRCVLLFFREFLIQRFLNGKGRVWSEQGYICRSWKTVHFKGESWKRMGLFVYQNKKDGSSDPVCACESTIAGSFVRLRRQCTLSGEGNSRKRGSRAKNDKMIKKFFKGKRRWKA